MQVGEVKVNKTKLRNSGYVEGSVTIYGAFIRLVINNCMVRLGSELPEMKKL